MAALEHHERQYPCPCGCGLPAVTAHDPKQPMLVDTVVCQARRALAIAQRDRAQMALPPRERKKGWVKGAGEWDDGLLWSVAPHDPDSMKVDG